ncbi:MAG: CRISPR system precrRNA processing endoribonuclease RAMP protein Cas6 [Chloroflexi bacterium]|nr:CRISPR system precrRNA processing endoribonuclease RAMP protein Cas6 [Chloroflexota bacterium]
MGDESPAVALVLVLAPQQPVTVPAHQGRAAHALLLRWAAESDPALAARLHEGSQARPFTASSLLDAPRLDRQGLVHLTPARPVALRFTSTDAALSQVLLAQAETPPSHVILGDRPFTVVSATTDPMVHPWAGQTTLEALSRRYRVKITDSADQVGLVFDSPTAFRRDGVNLLFPLPDLVWGSLAEAWNAVSAAPVNADLRDFAREGLVVSRFRLESRAVPFPGNVQLGCEGYCWYTFLNRDLYWRRQIHLLAAFAFYAGVGYRTAVGMGQVRALTRDS